MKKIIRLLLICVLLITLGNVVHAGFVKIKIDDIGIEITVPDGHMSYDRHLSNDNPFLLFTKVSKEAIVSEMISKDIYFSIWENKGTYKIDIIKRSQTADDLDKMDNAALSALQQSMITSYKERGITVRQYSIFEHKQTRFLRFNISSFEKKETIYALQYYTIVDNMIIIVSMKSFDGDINEAKESFLESFVSDISFYKHEAVASVAQTTATSASVTPTKTSESKTANNNKSQNNDDQVLRGNSVVQTLLSLVITFAVYSAPILIYRFGIRKEPVSNKTGRRITIIYAIVGILIMTLIKESISGSAVVGGGVLLWSFVNYFILTNGPDDEEAEDPGNAEKETANEELTSQEAVSMSQSTEIRVLPNENENLSDSQMNAKTNPIQQETPLERIDYYPFAFVTDESDNSVHYIPVKRCPACGVVLNEGAVFCHKCGTKID
ncbi:MAG: zinc ribbon domain-containing protein [Lachnospiraceae bacterium]|nr:zinc ribbon domain-containing protein [Lachnospiraceae bacterium]